MGILNKSFRELREQQGCMFSSVNFNLHLYFKASNSNCRLSAVLFYTLNKFSSLI